MDSKNSTKHYSNGEITIVWKPNACIHSTKCWRGKNALPEVFNPNEKPWVKQNAASTERIMQQINQCPSGALGFFKNEETETDSEEE